MSCAGLFLTDIVMLFCAWMIATEVAGMREELHRMNHRIDERQPPHGAERK